MKYLTNVESSLMLIISEIGETSSWAANLGIIFFPKLLEEQIMWVYLFAFCNSTKNGTTISGSRPWYASFSARSTFLSRPILANSWATESTFEPITKQCISNPNLLPAVMELKVLEFNFPLAWSAITSVLLKRCEHNWPLMEKFFYNFKWGKSKIKSIKKSTKMTSIPWQNLVNFEWLREIEP